MGDGSGGRRNSHHVDQILPFPFWRVSVGAATLTPDGGAPRGARVIPGYARGDPHPMLNICTVATGTGFTLEPGLLASPNQVWLSVSQIKAWPLLWSHDQVLRYSVDY